MNESNAFSRPVSRLCLLYGKMLLGATCYTVTVAKIPSRTMSVITTENS